MKVTYPPHLLCYYKSDIY